MVDVKITWDTHDNLIICDVNETQHKSICNFMLEQYFEPHQIYKQLDFSNESNIAEEYLKYLNHLLLNECSIMVIDARTNKIHAVAIVKWMTKKWRSWNQLPLMVDSPKLLELITLYHNMIVRYARCHPQHVFDSLHIFDYWVCEDLQTDAIFMSKFFEAIFEVGRHMRMPRVTCVALSKLEQSQLEQADFHKLNDISYSALYKRFNEGRPCAKLHQNSEAHVVLYEKELMPPLPYYSMTPNELREKKRESFNEIMRTQIDVDLLEGVTHYGSYCKSK